MNRITLGDDGPRVSRLGYGCMRIAGDGSREAIERGKRAVRAAVEAGYTLFDHADIYAGGRSESLFGELLRESPDLRGRITIMTKCGIRFAGDPAGDSPARYDFSEKYLVESVEGSLRRLGVEQIDVLLLHRPDLLADYAAVARAFDSLADAGKVRHFGVSNFSPSQVRLFAAATGRRPVANQVEINLHRIDALTDGTLDQCLELGITPQAWCPAAVVAYPAWENTLTPADEARIRAELERQCERYGAGAPEIALAWLMKHPAGIAPIVGTTTPARIAQAIRALDIDYRREDWYRLLEARTGRPVP